MSAALGGLANDALSQSSGDAAPKPDPSDAIDAGLEQPGEAITDDAQVVPEDEEEEGKVWPVPGGLHLSTYASRLCARVDRQGALDSGAAVLQLIDADSGQPLTVHDLSFERGPMLSAGGRLELPGVEAHVRMLAMPTEHHGDQRVRALMHVELINHGQDLVVVRLGARLSAGGGDPLRRPADALEFLPGTRFAQEDDLITRDGSAILTWEGPAPEVEFVGTGAPATGDAAACTLTWELTVQPNTARMLDLALAGAAHARELDEAGWREVLSNWSFSNLEEQLTWQTDYRGSYTVFNCALSQLNRALDSSIHFLRTLGEANREVLWLTDRPYGFPPTDAAVPAEITGVFYEWGMGAFAEAYLRELVDTATAAGQQLSPERRVALVAGLVSAVRQVSQDEELVQGLAEAIRSLVVKEAPVEPWLDPEIVRADLAEILMRADPVGGAEAAGKLPVLRWAERSEGPMAEHMLAARKALSAGEREVFWEHFSALLASTNRNGLGSMQPGDDLDGRFPVGLMFLARAMLIDDHGRDLRLLPGVHQDMLPEHDELDLPWLPTTFGLVDIETYHVPGRRLATTLRLRQAFEPNLIFVYTPTPLQVQRVIDSFGGMARLMPDGSISAAIDPFLATGLNFTVSAREEPPGSR